MKAGKLALAIAVCAAAANARDWPDSGGWNVFELSRGCAVHQEFEGKGDTELLLSLDTDQEVIVLVSNSNWSVKDGEKFEVDWLLNGVSYTGNSVGSTSTDGKKGFGGKFDAKFLNDFSAASGLRMMREGTLIDNLSLSGTSVAVPMLKRCVAAKAAQDAADYKRDHQFDHIPTDPFAKPTAGGAMQATEASTDGSLIAGFYGRDSYPPAALRDGAEGNVRVRLNVDPDGRVKDCVVTSSSGNSALDDTTCRIARSRVRISQQQLNGRTSIEQTVRWSLSQ